MAFIIPDKILETLICDSCSKYLSVKPIMVYPNRRKKCGRCSRSKKQLDGVVSLYKNIAEKCLFKCVNRFDGCRDLLTYSQVREHEKLCLSKVYKCPICRDCSDVPTFLLMKHFRDIHLERILEYPGLFYNLHQHSETSQIYLYQLDDNVFFLQFSSSKSEELIRINLSYLGDSKAAKNISQQFIVTSDNKEFKLTSKLKSCNAYGLGSSDLFCLKIPHSTQAIFIEFKIVFKTPTLIPVSLNFGSSDLNILAGPKLSTNNVTNVFSPMVIEATPRKIFLSKSFQQTFPRISLNKCGSAIVQSDVIYFLHCFNCHEICWRGLSRDNLVQQFYFSIKFEHSVCYYCFQMLKHEKKVNENDYMISNFHSLMFKIIEFYCKWNCGNTFCAEDHLGHEQSCGLQPLQPCPESNCNFQGTIAEIADHMVVHPFKEICTYSNFYISCLFDRNVYIFIQNQFVHLKIVSINQDISLYLNENDSEKNKNKPVVLLFDDNKFFLMTFQNSITKNEGNHWVKIILTK